MNIRLVHLVLLILYVGLISKPDSTANAADADHLIISEFQAMTRNPPSLFGSPFIEVNNPTAGDIDMSEVYLTDATTVPAALYYNISLTDPGASNPGGGNGGDFHAKFPAGFTLEAGQSVVIAINGSTEYFSAFGRQPDFELFEDGTAPDGVAELVEAFPGSINAGPLGGNNVPALADVAESLVLYQWDGTADNVVDLDYVMWGTNESVRIDKTGVTIGTHTYLDDTAVGDQDPVANSGPTFRHSFQRVSTDEGTETLTGGNGISGHDETSENLATTWADVDPADPAVGLPVAFPPAPIITELSNSNAIDGVVVVVTATAVTFGTFDTVDFFYSVDGGAYTSVSGSDAGDDQWIGTIPAQAGGTVVDYYCLATNTQGQAASFPLAAPRFHTNGYTVGPPEVEPTKLLITEVNTGVNIYPFVGMHQLAMEFIEIHNPSDEAVDLSDYYITDAINYNYTTQLYWYIALGSPSQQTVGGGHYNDFTARFPLGYQIGPGATITISIAGSEWFQSYYGFAPDLELYEDGLEQDTIPDMRPVFENPDDDLPGNSIFTADRPYGGSSDEFPKGIPELEEHYGEPLILYHWQQGHDLVTDIDIFIWGEGKFGDFRYGFDKTGETVGQSTYQPDTPVLEQDWFLPVTTMELSYCRVDTLEGSQPTSGSNGVDGRDETGEDLDNTFEMSIPSPGVFISGSTGPPPTGQWQDITFGSLADTADNQAHAWGDFDGDGDEDLYLVRNSSLRANSLLVNRGNLIFSETSFGLEDFGFGTDASWGDINNDGSLDIIVANNGGPNRVFWGSRDIYGNFMFFWPESNNNLNDVNMTVATDWIDFDQDGRIEAYVSNLDGPNQMLLGRFAFYDVVPAGLEFPGPTGSFQWCDFDRDLDADLGMVTDLGQVHFLQQSESGIFQDSEMNVAPTGSGCTWGDYDNDGDFDAFLTFMSARNMLFENQGESGFQPVESSVFDNVDNSLSGIWGDYDNDGFLDLFEVNNPGANRLLRNEGGTGQFTSIQDSLFTDELNSSCATWSDIDADGDLDLYISNLGSPNQLLRNNLGITEKGNNWISVKLEGNPGRTQSNRCAIGAIIRVDTSVGSQWRFVSSGSGHAGQSPFRQHFGLGETSIIERITVYWPYILPWGQHHTTVLENIEPNQVIYLVEEIIGPSPVVEESLLPVTFRLDPCRPNPFNPITSIPFDLPQRISVEMKVFDLRGRLVRTLIPGDERAAGQHEAVWDGRDDTGQNVAAGVYFYKLTAGDFEDVKRMVLVK